jgi:hypothetical protein
MKAIRENFDSVFWGFKRKFLLITLNGSKELSPHLDFSSCSENIHGDTGTPVKWG